MVLACEMLVDWLKHAFITKFNHIRPSVYERYTDVLCLDLSSGSAVGRLQTRKVNSSSLLGIVIFFSPFLASIRTWTSHL
jgi:hypothetical protein